MRATIATVILLLNINLAKATTSKEELIQKLDELKTATNQASFTQPDKYKGSLVLKEKLVKADNLNWDYLLAVSRCLANSGHLYNPIASDQINKVFELIESEPDKPKETWNPAEFKTRKNQILDPQENLLPVSFENGQIAKWQNPPQTSSSCSSIKETSQKG